MTMKNHMHTFEFWRDQPFRNDFVIWGGIGLLVLSWSIWELPDGAQFVTMALVGLGLIFTAGSGRKFKVHFATAQFTDTHSLWYVPYRTHTRDLSEFTRVELRLFSENQQMNMLSISQITRTRVFDIILANDQGEELKVAYYTDYAEARDYLNVLADGLSIPAVNTFEQFKAKLQQRGQAEKRRRTAGK